MMMVQKTESGAPLLRIVSASAGVPDSMPVTMSTRGTEFNLMIMAMDQLPWHWSGPTTGTRHSLFPARMRSRSSRLLIASAWRLFESNAWTRLQNGDYACMFSVCAAAAQY